jgi:hypothetical protein
LNWKAEFIVNFAIDWLTAYVKSKETFRKIYPSLGISHVLPIEKVFEATANPKFDAQYVVESLIGPAFKEVSASPFFSPFYIQAPKSNRGYWLVHLAPQRRARFAMLDVYWRNANGCRHFGHTGLDMLSYKPNANPTGYLEGLEFGDVTGTDVQKHLVQDFAKKIRDNHASGISYDSLLNEYCNQTMANKKIIHEALVDLMQSGEIEVAGQKGGGKRVDRIESADVIKPGYSPFLLRVPRSQKKPLKPDS